VKNPTGKTRYKSKKVGTIDVREDSPLSVPAEYLGMSPDDITAYVMGGMIKGDPKAAPRPGYRKKAPDGEDEFADFFARVVRPGLKSGKRTEADLSAREKAALELQREIQSLRKQLVDEDDGEDLVL
tara:strand:+ start:3719 stop:4099 length:381 start_codon:yes stop_codon:yes gene_type:complete